MIVEMSEQSSVTTQVEHVAKISNKEVRKLILDKIRSECPGVIIPDDASLEAIEQEDGKSYLQLAWKDGPQKSE